MSKLSDLYKAMETFRKESTVNEDLEKKVNELEEEIMKNCWKIKLLENFEQLPQTGNHPIRFAYLF